ncbi:MAG: glycosyltransferase family 39 protein [Desulfobulbaceae bacterium]|nr:glycosyltransferase family 39 protein [Desulfobulbaceae bacterium]
MVTLIVTLGLMAGVPPVDRDALTHHLYVPKLYLAQGGIVELPQIVFSYFPMNLDLLYMIVLYFGNDIAPKYLHFAFGLATALLVYRYTVSRFGAVNGLLGALLFLSIPVIAKLCVTVYVDLGLIFFSTAGLLALLRWMREGLTPRYLIIGGLCCGLAAGCKYNGLITIFILSAFVPFMYQRSQPVTKRSDVKAIAQLGIFLSAVLLTFSPWLIRNALWTGNPLFPLYGTIFQNTTQVSMSENEDNADSGPSQMVKKLSGTNSNLFYQRKLLYGENFYQILLLPIRFFYQGKDDDPRFFDGKLNPFLLFFSFLPLCYRSQYEAGQRREHNYLLAFALLYFFLSFFSETQRVRYVSPMLPPLVILSVAGISSLFRQLRNGIQIRNAVMCYGAIALVSGMYLYNVHYLTQLFSRIEPLSYLSGKLSREEYISLRRPEYPLVKYINENIPENSVILAVFLGKRGYYFDRKVYFDSLTGKDSLTTMARSATDGEGIARSLRDNKINYILIRNDMFQQWITARLSKNEVVRLEEFFQNFTVIVSRSKDHLLFKIL